MTYITCKKLIERKKQILNELELQDFFKEMTEKLDIFLLNNRITSDEYNELIKMLK